MHASSTAAMTGAGFRRIQAWNACSNRSNVCHVQLRTNMLPTWHVKTSWLIALQLIRCYRGVCAAMCIGLFTPNRFCFVQERLPESDGKHGNIGPRGFPQSLRGAEHRHDRPGRRSRRLRQKILPGLSDLRDEPVLPEPQISFVHGGARGALPHRRSVWHAASAQPFCRSRSVFIC